MPLKKRGAPTPLVVERIRASAHPLPGLRTEPDNKERQLKNRGAIQIDCIYTHTRIGQVIIVANTLCVLERVYMREKEAKARRLLVC